MVKNKTNAFTLAEVLITLGIIGVVAAITIPTLMTNMKGAQYRAKYKKALSTLSQSIKMAQAQYDMDFSAIDSACQSTTDDPDNIKSICALFNGTMKGSWSEGEGDSGGGSYFFPQRYFNSQYWSHENSYVSSSAGFMYQLPDGAYVFFADYIGSDGCGKIDSEAYASAAFIPPYGKWKCMALVDVDGPYSGKNDLVHCDNGSFEDEECIVSNKNITDVFPVLFYNGTVEPASGAAKYVINTSK